LNIVFLEPTDAELDEAASYYNTEQTNLGEMFYPDIQNHYSESQTILSPIRNQAFLVEGDWLLNFRTE